MQGFPSVCLSVWLKRWIPTHIFFIHVGINKSDKPNRMSDLFNFSPCLNVCFSFPEVFLVRNRKPWNIFWIFCKEINCQETIVFTYKHQCAQRKKSLKLRGIEVGRTRPSSAADGLSDSERASRLPCASVSSSVKQGLKLSLWKGKSAS